MQELMSVDTEQWLAEIPDIDAHFSAFGSRLPEKLRGELRALVVRLG